MYKLKYSLILVVIYTHSKLSFLFLTYVLRWRFYWNKIIYHIYFYYINLIFNNEVLTMTDKYDKYESMDEIDKLKFLADVANMY